MNRCLRSAMAGAMALGAIALASAEAGAAPAQNLATLGAAAAPTAPAIEKAYVVCGPFRCFRRGGWGWRRPYYGYGWGWHRGWRRW